MRIVLLTHYFPPEVNAPAQRAHDHAREWKALGHDVTIVTAAPSHPYGQLYPGYSNKTGVDDIDGIRVLRLKTLLGANSGKLKRSLNYLSYPISVLLNLRRIGAADVVISTSPQFFCGLVGYPVARYYRIPWALEIRDIWPDSIVAVGAAKPSLATKCLGKLVRWAYKKADFIVSVSSGFQSHFDAYNVPRRKLNLIPNGIKTDEQRSQATFVDFPELQKFESRKIAAFIGTLGMAHGLESLLNAAKILEHDSRIGILLVGAGAEHQKLHQLVEDKKLSNVIILDQLPRDRILKLWSLVSYSIVHLKNNDLFKTVIPTKLLEAMSMSKPILLGVDGTAKQILTDANAGIYVEPENPASIAQGILDLVNDPEMTETYGLNGRNHVLKHFDRKEMALRYVELLENCNTN